MSVGPRSGNDNTTNGNTATDVNAIGGVILAGGRGRRLGGVDKALVKVAGRPLLAWVAERAGPQVEPLFISANGDPARFAAFGLPVLADDIPDYAGPLAGVVRALDHLALIRPDIRLLATFPCDTPLFPDHLVAQLAAARLETGSEIAFAVPDGRPQHLLALWMVASRHRLRAFLVNEGGRRVRDWLDGRRTVGVAFLEGACNINEQNELVAAEARLGCRPDPPGGVPPPEPPAFSRKSQGSGECNSPGGCGRQPAFKDIIAMKVLYFARLAELVGTREDNVELPPGPHTVADAVATLAAANPRFAAAYGDGGWLRIAVNQRFAGPTAPIAPGDELAFFPPMTGG